MSVLPAPAPVLSGVDDVLLAMTRDAVGTTVGVTSGPLDRPVTGARLNWFLYRITPAPALMNMEPPQTGWRTPRGKPPLALTLHYLLAADPGELTPTGNEMGVAHDGLINVMALLNEHAVLGPDTLITASPARTVSQVTGALDALVEPLRITLDQVPLETITGLWASGLKSLRLSVAYQVSLVIVPSPVSFVPGPPVQERHVAVSPTMGPAITTVQPALVSFGDEITVAATGLGPDLLVTLSRADGDPGLGPADWALAVTRTRTGLTTKLPNFQLVPGRRALTITNQSNNLPAGVDGAALTVAPAVLSGPAALVRGSTATLTVAHVLDEGRVAFGGLAVPYPRTGAGTVDVVVPAGVAAFAGQEIAVSIESATVTGRPHRIQVAP